MQTDIVEGNVMIAEFMEYGYRDESGFIDWVINGVAFDEEHLKFHSSWDWMMTVVEKIARCLTKEEEVIYNGEDSYFDSYYLRTFGMLNSQTKEFMVRINRFSLHKSVSLIDATWAAVVEFIKYWNTQQVK